MPAHQLGESIEGMSIEGHSRDPLRSKPAKKINGVKCFVFKAEFNVFAEIIVGLANNVLPNAKIEALTLTAKGETLGSNTAVITSITKAHTPHGIYQKHVSHVSHTHGANVWAFNQQTNVKVVTPRQEITDVLHKRNINAMPQSVLTKGD